VERESVAARRAALATLKGDDDAIRAGDRRLEKLLSECAVLGGQQMTAKRLFSERLPVALRDHSGIGAHRRGFSEMCARFVAGKAGGTFLMPMTGSSLHHAVHDFLVSPLSQRWGMETADILAALEAELNAAPTTRGAINLTEAA
jgi:hypothetical protein